ncbi:MAG TPA: AIPR family protein [Clostridia bacterium]|nr:AIPR family protein [Clostridia bacterium]
MTTTDLKVLDDILAESRTQFAPEMKEDDYFELFAAQQVLRDKQLDNEEVQYGITGRGEGGSDGGIDAIYLLVNGRLIRDEEQAQALRTLKQNIQVDLIVIQATRETSFVLQRLLRLKDTCSAILSLDLEPKHFSETYNEALLDVIGRFRIAHKVLSTKFPKFTLSYVYVSRGDVQSIAPLINDKACEIENDSKSLLPTITEATFKFIGARQLIEIAHKPPKSSFDLKCSDSVASDKCGLGAIALVKLSDYLRFITDENTGELLSYLFESNVRDYQGDVSVNEGIKSTLEHHGANEFWWLNNGITIVAEKLTPTTKQLIFEDPQIVNGLQTSQEIFNYFRSHPEAKKTDDRELVVRVIGSSNSDVHDSIIRATNSQTSIPAASLWATESIHRDIERVFKSSGLYYDRRKNSWRRRNEPLARVVGITELAQAVAAILLQEPDHARARPARYFQKANYHKVFNTKFDIGLYSVCAHVRKATEAYLRKAETDRRHRNNLLFYVMMATVSLHLRRPRASAGTIAQIDVGSIPETVFERALSIVRPIYVRFGETDRAAKGADLVAALRVEIVNTFNHRLKRVAVASK